MCRSTKNTTLSIQSMAVKRTYRKRVEKLFDFLEWKTRTDVNCCMQASRRRLYVALSFCVCLIIFYASFRIQTEIRQVPIVNHPPHVDEMGGLLIRPDIIAHSTNDNFKIWPFPVTQLEYSWRVFPREPCSGEVFLLVLVHSRPHFSRSRLVIRETWGSVAVSSSSQARIVFVTALSPNNTTVNEDLITENEQFNDIIQFDFTDSYFNLTLKSLMDFKWAAHFCPQAQFIAKTDDDVFVDISKLINLLESRQRVEDTMIGDLIHRGKVERDHPKWAVPASRFPAVYYPRYLKGTAYVISGDLASKIIEAARYVLPIHVDDVFITGIMASILNVTLVHLQQMQVPRSVGSPLCILEVLGRVVVLGEENPYLISDDDHTKHHKFQYELWLSLRHGRISFYCSLWSAYYRLMNLF